MRAGKVAQQFTALAALPEGSGLVPNTRVSGLTTSVTLPPGDLKPVSGLRGYLHLNAHTHTHTRLHII